MKISTEYTDISNEVVVAECRPNSGRLSVRAPMRNVRQSLAVVWRAERVRVGGQRNRLADLLAVCVNDVCASIISDTGIPGRWVVCWWVYVGHT